MNDIAREMLTHSDRKHLKNVLFQRQFLPMSNSPKYDVVVSSFSLLELPSVGARLETVLNLWNKTGDFLVLIEFGTMAGFKVITEARDFLLWGMRKKSAQSCMKGHVVSPCPHDKKCPLQSSEESSKPCNFSATFTSFPQKPLTKKELYSYVILKKGSRPANDSHWPRIIRPVLLRHKHAICRMCTPEGKFSEVIFTPNKHGKATFRCAKQSKWGDRLPMSIQDLPNDSETNLEVHNLQDTERDVTTNTADQVFHDAVK
uniref:Copper-fist domain-containing protein n=2 Tax=Lygus hesperus TaxID=30085 RepID=A0A0K8T2A1_LYGHE